MKIKHYLIASALVGSMAGLAYAASNVDVGTTGSSQGTVTIHGGTSGSAVIGTPAAAGTTTFTLPAGNGSAGQVLEGDGSGNLSYVGPLTFCDLTWGPGQNLATAALPVCFTAVSATVTGLICRPEVVEGGAATFKVFYAASGTALGAGTQINTTDCNANTGAGVTQLLGISVSAIPAGSYIGIVGTGFGTTNGSGMFQVSITKP